MNWHCDGIGTAMKTQKITNLNSFQTHIKHIKINFSCFKKLACELAQDLFLFFSDFNRMAKKSRISKKKKKDGNEEFTYHGPVD